MVGTSFAANYPCPAGAVLRFTSAASAPEADDKGEMFNPIYNAASLIRQNQQNRPPVSALRRVLTALAFGEITFALFLLIPLMIFLRPYHALRAQAAAFDTSPGCRSVAPLPLPVNNPAVTACTIEWANVTKRYYRESHSSRSGPSYWYYLDVTGGYGDQHTIELKELGVWQAIATGEAIKLQRWEDRITAVALTSGETSPTAQNPDWQLHNDQFSLRILTILFAFFAAVGAACLLLLRQLPA
ncbi:MAG: hypothetical protein JOZ50_10230 [Candidatus Eremiobacteraeota bacterium]|nr:hypothetical protein [Candidatus Eremiobacteraeota bacterium]MBV8669468.1 hypothetical protein [Candidatus Eremiobacteraeota bacterium]